MTRSTNSSYLFELDPEIERTLHLLKRIYIYINLNFYINN